MHTVSLRDVEACCCGSQLTIWRKRAGGKSRCQMAFEDRMDYSLDNGDTRIEHKALCVYNKCIYIYISTPYFDGRSILEVGR